MTFKVWHQTQILTVLGVSSRDRLVVRTLRCGRSNPGSNPGHGSDILNKLLTFSPNLSQHEAELVAILYRSVGGIVVSIAAFQAVDPGSIPGRRMMIFFLFFFYIISEMFTF